MLGRKPFNGYSITGLDPVVYKTPWNQKVIYDRQTYADMKAGECLKEGFSWKKVEILRAELNAIIETGEIQFTK